MELLGGRLTLPNGQVPPSRARNVCLVAHKLVRVPYAMPYVVLPCRNNKLCNFFHPSRNQICALDKKHEQKIECC